MSKGVLAQTSVGRAGKHCSVRRAFKDLGGLEELFGAACHMIIRKAGDYDV